LGHVMMLYKFHMSSKSNAGMIVRMMKWDTYITSALTRKNLPPSADVKNGGGIPSLPNISSWHSALIN
jgi:hypothetical protein